MTRPRLVWLAFGISLLVALGGAGWLSQTALALERAAAKGRVDATLEENARLALWRLDSAVAPLLALENARPVSGYAGASLASAPGNHVLLHFQLERGGALVSPDAPRATDLEDLRRQVGDFANLETLALRTGAADLPSAPPTLPNADTQQTKNDQEWLARNFNAERGNRYAYSVGNALGPVAPPAPLPTHRIGELLQPSWIGDRLILVRKVQVDGRDVLQGTVLDWPVLKASLLAQVGDLLEGASLQANGASSGGARSEHRLAMLPVSLIPGRVPGGVPPDPEDRAVLLVLAAAWVSMLLAVAAVAALLVGTLALSERRAAFVSSVTHELRTPLTTFRMYTEMLAGGMVTDEAQRQGYLTTLQRESDRLSHLVENVLAYSRIERGRGPAHTERLALGPLLERQTERLRERASQAKLELVVDAGPPDLSAEADASAVEQILFNLVDNAAKYASASTPPRIELGAGRESGQVTLRVRDYGPGLDSEARRGLFTPFSKSAQRAALSAPGVGLGLALCKQLAQEMGGDLRYESPPGGGTAFVLRLKRA